MDSWPCLAKYSQKSKTKLSNFETWILKCIVHFGREDLDKAYAWIMTFLKDILEEDENAPPINISISKLNVSHHYGQKETMSLCPVSPPLHWASTPANEAKVLWKQCGPLTEKDALCSAADFQSEWISGAEVAYLITACCLGWKWTMSLGISLPCLYIHPEIANRTVLIQHKGKWVRLFIYFHTINPLWHALVS